MKVWPEVNWRIRAEDAAFEDNVRVVAMPCCGFAFGDDYADEILLSDVTALETYTCPLCEPGRWSLEELRQLCGEAMSKDVEEFLDYLEGQA